MHIKDLFGQHLVSVEENKCCKLCKHSYLRDDTDKGYCKLQENSFSPMHPKIIDEMHVCDLWEKK